MPYISSNIFCKLVNVPSPHTNTLSLKGVGSKLFTFTLNSMLSNDSLIF